MASRWKIDEWTVRTLVGDSKELTGKAMKHTTSKMLNRALDGMELRRESSENVSKAVRDQAGLDRRWTWYLKSFRIKEKTDLLASDDLVHDGICILEARLLSSLKDIVINCGFQFQISRIKTHQRQDERQCDDNVRAARRQKPKEF